jgi:hypothetical protein
LPGVQRPSLFDLVFFVRVHLGLLRGTTIPAVSRWLNVAAPIVNLSVSDRVQPDNGLEERA